MLVDYCVTFEYNGDAHIWKSLADADVRCKIWSIWSKIISAVVTETTDVKPAGLQSTQLEHSAWIKSQQTNK